MLNVYYDSPIGYVTEEFMTDDGYKTQDIQLYKCNGLLAMMTEYTNDDGELVRQLYGFFCDRQHMENCFGFHGKQGFSDHNMFDYPQHHWTVFAIDKTSCRDYNTIVKAVAKAFDNITIKIYTTGADK